MGVKLPSQDGPNTFNYHRAANVRIIEIRMSKKSENLKQELFSSLLKTRNAIIQEASQLSTEAQNTVFLGTWSLKDLLAHLAGWDFTNLAAVKDIQAGKLPEFYAHYDKDWKTFNANLVAKYKRDDFDELLALVRDSQHQLIEYLETLPAEAFEKDFGVRSGRGARVTIARLLQAELEDEQEHLRQIQDFVGKL
jgi:hypothetical protein